MSLKIVVYSKSACPQCESAKMILKSKSLAYEEIKIDDEAERMAFYEKCGPSCAKCHRFSSTISAWVAWLVCRLLWLNSP